MFDELKIGNIISTIINKEALACGKNLFEIDVVKKGENINSSH